MAETKGAVKRVAPCRNCGGFPGSNVGTCYACEEFSETMMGVKP